MELAANAIGITGVTLILIAYFLVSTNRVSGQDWRFHALNFIGALLHIASLYVFWNLPSFVIECFWIAISAYGLWKAWKPQKAA